MVQCRVMLDNYQTGYYYPGSQVQGRVILNFDSETKFRNVKLGMLGLEHTEWTTMERVKERGSRHNKIKQVRHTGNNTFFNMETILYGTNTGTTILPTGQHTYPFTCTLPYDIPGNYSSEYGSISFKLVAIVDRPMAFDYRDELTFVVVTIIDLNNLQTPELLEPASYSNSKSLYCCCCSQGPISMDVHLPKRSLIPEETVNVSVRLTNLSRKNVERLELKLKQRISYKVKLPSESEKILKTKVIHLNEVGLGPHGEHTYTFPVKLPMNFSILNFPFCQLFKVQYYYEVIAKLPGIQNNLKVTMYPSLGNIEVGPRGDSVINSSYSGPLPYSEQPSGSGLKTTTVQNPYHQDNHHAQTPSSYISLSAPIMGQELPPSYESLHPTKY